MYMYDYDDIIFFIKHFKYPSNHFDISQYVKFSHSNTRSTSHNKLQYNIQLTTYFVTPTFVDYQEYGMPYRLYGSM